MIKLRKESHVNVRYSHLMNVYYFLNEAFYFVQKIWNFSCFHHGKLGKNLEFVLTMFVATLCK